MGLGNPGPEYAGTRHNVGFEVVDRLARAHRIDLKTRRHQAVYGVGTVDGIGMLLVKPLTFMNLSGQAVAALRRQYNLDPERIVVIADDLDLAPGTVKMRPHGGAGGHNGHRSLIHSLGTDRYPRIKIGIGKPPEIGRDHVLSRFTPDEKDLIEPIYERILFGIRVLAAEGIEKAITAVNSNQ